VGLLSIFFSLNRLSSVSSWMHEEASTKAKSSTAKADPKKKTKRTN